MPGIKEQAETILAVLYQGVTPSVKQATKVGIGILLVLVVLGSGLILQTSYAQTLKRFSFDFTTYPLKGSQPDQYAILIRPQTQSGDPLTDEATLTRSITVSGSGQANAQLDQAVVSLGVQTEAAAAEHAMAENNDKLQSLLNTLEQSGIAAEDIQTQALQLYPRYTPEPRQVPQVEAYVAMNRVEVKVREIEQLGDLLNAAVQVDGNTIQGIQFEVSNPSRSLDQARQAAIEDARHKAEQLTSLLDTQLGEVLVIDETSQIPLPVTREAATIDQAAVIEPGTQSLQVDVEVTWLLR